MDLRRPEQARGVKFIDGFHSLCLDKKDIMLAEKGKCKIHLRACRDEVDRKAVEKEIVELKTEPDPLPRLHEIVFVLNHVG